MIALLVALAATKRLRHHPTMKRLITLLFVIALLPAGLFAQTNRPFTFTWTNTTPAVPDQYKIYEVVGTSRTLVATVSRPSPTTNAPMTTVINIPSGQHSYVVTARTNNGGESAASNVAIAAAEPAAPTNLTVTAE